MTSRIMKLLSFLIPQTVFKTTSKFSGEIKVIDHVFERRLVVGGLTQSGGILKSMWEKALNQSFVVSRLSLVNNVLVLGLGAGTVAEIISKKWPSVRIVGVEIDPEIVDIGKKYFHLNDIKNLEIIATDAIPFISKLVVSGEKFAVIIVDLYRGYVMEKELQNEVFLQNIAQISAKNGIVIFNVLKPQNGNFEARIFLDKLQRIYKDYFCKRIISNDFFFAQKSITKGGDLSMARRKAKKRKR